jgi:hypothetical protein
MRRILLLAIIAFAAAASADEPLDGPKHPFHDDLIENLAGKWKLSSTVRGRQIENSVTADWVLDHQFLLVHMKDVAVPPAYEAMVTIGYSYADKRYIAYWCDTFGGKFSAAGHGTRNGNSIEFVFDYPEGPFYNTFAWDPAAKTWTFRLENSNGKDRKLFAIETLSRP